MRDVIYSDEVMDRLDKLKENLIEYQGEKKGKKTLCEIVDRIEELAVFPGKGLPVSERFNVNCNPAWHVLYIPMNYYIYKWDDEHVYILKMYDYREDIMQRLFGTSMRSLESIKYWGE
jgi:hypothetical protein